MFKLLVWLLLGYGAFAAYGWYQDRQFNSGAYVSVYGRDRCSVTQNALRSLRQAGVPHRYYIVDDPQVADPMHAMMKSQGLSTRRYLLPVVDTNGTLAIRPSMAEVIQEYQRALTLLGSS